MNVKRSLLKATYIMLYHVSYHIFLKTIPPKIFLGDIENGKKLHTIKGVRKGTEDQPVGHTAHILCMAISSDGKYLVSSVLKAYFACLF